VLKKTQNWRLTSGAGNPRENDEMTSRMSMVTRQHARITVSRNITDVDAEISSRSSLPSQSCKASRYTVSVNVASEVRQLVFARSDA
jgi:hypothetical protein